MRLILIAALIALSMPATAKQRIARPEPMAAPTDESMQAIMGMSQCIQEKVGDEGMKRMQKAGEVAESVLGDLCRAGKRKQAVAYHAEMGRKMLESEDYQQIQSCSQQYAAALSDPGFAAMAQVANAPKLPEKGHLCDTYTK